ncbi:MAG: LacI family DNA-binding transcriptional regulator [Armatimonadota bacterium]
MSALRRSVSRQDVAELAGVSHITVTRVLQNHQYVAEETKRRVLEACEQLGYRYNRLASSLRSRRSHVLALISAQLDMEYYARLLHSVQESCAELQYHAIVAQLPCFSPVEQQMQEVDFLIQRQIDGLIISTALDDSVKQFIAHEQLPAVFVEDLVEGFTCISSDDINGSIHAVNYLLELGHRRILHLSGAERHLTAIRRRQGYFTAYEQNGIECDPSLTIITDQDAPSGYASTKQAIEQRVNFTAILAHNDYVAAGSHLAVFEAGLKVPDDVSIVGYAGERIGRFSTPPLTTVSQPIEEIGHRAVLNLVGQLDHGEKPGGEILLSQRLLVRGSTGGV